MIKRPTSELELQRRTAGVDSGRKLLRMHLAAAALAHPRNQSPPNNVPAMVTKALEMADEIILQVDP